MKYANERTAFEPTVSAADLAAAITTAASMGIREKEQVCDRIPAEQPSLLGSVLAQHVLLHILIVLYLAIEQSGQVLAIVSEADQERELQRFTAAVRFTEGLAGDALAQSIEQTTAYRRERSSCSPMSSTPCVAPASRTCAKRRPRIPSWRPSISSTHRDREAHDAIRPPGVARRCLAEKAVIDAYKLGGCSNPGAGSAVPSQAETRPWAALQQEQPWRYRTRLIRLFSA
jgi:hypothetical protein